MNRAPHIAVAIAILAGASCRAAAVAPTGAGQVTDLRVEAAALDRAIASGAVDQASLLRRAELALVFDRDGTRTAELLSRAGQFGPLPVDGVLLACHLANRERRYVDLERACGEVLERFPDRPEAEEAALLASSIYGQTVDADTRVADTVWSAAERCRPDGSGHSCAGLAYRAARGRLSQAAQRKDAAGYRTTLDTIGALRSWQVCGPIAPDAVERYRELRDAVRDGASLAARIGGAACSTRELATDEIRPLASSLAGVHVLRSYWHVPHARSALLIARTPGAALVLVDGRTVVNRDTWLHLSDATATVALQLETGWHELAILSWTPGSYDSVSAYLIDDRGRAVFDRAVAMLPAGEVLTGAKRIDATQLASAQLERNLDPAAQPWRALRLIELLNDENLGDGERARAVATDLTAAHPDSGLAWLLLAEAVESDGTLPKTVRESQMRRALTRALELRPPDLVGRYRLARLDFDERPDESLARMRALIADRPDYAPGQRQLSEMLQERGLVVEAAGPLAAALTLAPGELSLERVEQYYREQGAIQRALAARLARLDLEPSLASDRRSRWLVDHGDLPGALAAAELTFALAPDRHGFGRLLELARSTEGDAGVQQRARARLTNFPHDMQAAEWLVRSAQASGDAQQLAAALASAERAQPGDPLWERYRLQAADQDLDALMPIDTAALLADFKRHQQQHPEIFRGHGRVYLLDAMARVLIPGGGSFSITHQLFKVQSKEAASELGEVRIPADADRRVLRVIKPDGRVVEPEAEHAGGATSLAGIEVGDVIEMRYLLSRWPDRIDRTFWERFNFAAAHPIFSCSYQLIGADDDLAALDVTALDAPSPVRDRIAGRTRLSFSARAVPALRPEPFAGPTAETTPHVTISRGVDVALYAHRAARSEAWSESTNCDVVAFAHAAVRGQPDQRAQLAALVRAVLKQVPNPRGEGNPIEVLATGRGDRLALLRAACLAVGLDARLIGVHRASPLAVVDWDDRSLSEQYLLVLADGQPVPVSVNALAPQIGLLPPSDAGGTAIEIDPARPMALGRTEPIPMQWLQRAPDRYQVDATLDAAGALRGRLDVAWLPPFGSAFRHAIRSAPRQNTRQWIEAWLGEQFSGATLEEMQVDGLDDELAPLQLHVRFAAPAFASAVDGALVVERFLPSFTLSPVGERSTPASYLRVARRRSALYLQPRYEEMSIRVRLPAGRQPLALPDAIDESGRYGSYRQRSRVDQGALLVERTIDMPFVRVPADEYPALRALGELISGRTSTQLVLR